MIFFLKKVAFSYYTKRGGSRFGIKSTKMTLKTREYIVQLIVRQVQGILDDEGQRELLEWRGSSPENEVLFQRMTSRVHFEESLKVCEMTNEEMENEWKLIRGKTIGSYRLVLKRLLPYAAILVVALLVGGIWVLGERDSLLPDDSLVAKAHRVKKIEPQAILVMGDGTTINLKDSVSLAALVSMKMALSADEDVLTYTKGSVDTVIEYHTMKIPRGGEYVLVLSDGTTVYLNAESELRFPKQFRGKNRKVYLTGEGYFDVQRNEKQPFIVEVKQVEVRVLGTSFGIRAYAKEENVLTTLIQGRVNVEADGQQVELNPGQQADFNRGNDRLTVAEVDVEQYVGWKDGRLVFDNKPLEFILEELGRWYSFDVFYTNKELKGIPYSLNIKKHEDIAHVLKFIERTGKVKFEVNKNTIIVK